MLIRQLATEDRLNRSTCNYTVVLWLCHARTCNCNNTAHIDLSCEEEATENYNILNVQSPDLLALVDWVDVVNLNTYIACRVLTLEGMQLYALNLRLLTASVVREVYLTIGQTAQYIKSLLQWLLLVSKCKVVVDSERCAVECRHENSLWLIAWRSDNTVRTLNKHRPQTRFEQKFDNLLTRCFRKVKCGEVLVCNLLVCGNDNRENLALLTTIDSSNSTADRRGKENLRTLLVEEEWRTCLYCVTNLNKHLWDNALEIEWRHSILRSQRSIDYRLLCLSLQANIQTFAKFNDFRHVFCVFVSE